MLKKFRLHLQSPDKRSILVNFFSLSVLQAANYVLPLITVPYLVRVLGPAKFGVISFAQALIQYFIIFTNYGFNFSATRDISVNRDNPHTISEIFSSVMIARIILTVISLIILCGIVFFIPRFKSDTILYLLSFGMVVGDVLCPLWFFQGMEKMKYITFLNIIAKLIFTVSIFIVIKQESDYLYVPLLNSAGFIIAGIWSLKVVHTNFQIKFYLPQWSSIVGSMRNSFFFFLSRLSLSLYTVTNTFILGMFTSNEITGYYAAADKIVSAVRSLNQPIANVLYPYISRTKNTSIYKKIFYSWTAGGFILFIVFFFFNNLLTSIIFGPEFKVTANILKLFSFMFPIIYISIMLGLPYLAALGYPKYFNMSVIYGSLFQIVGLLIIIPFINIYYVVIITIVTEIIVLLIRIYGIKKHKLWQYTNPS